MSRSSSAQAAGGSGSEQTNADRCEHAIAVFGDGGTAPRSGFPEAEVVALGEEGEGLRLRIKSLANQAQSRGIFGPKAAASISRLAQAALEDGFPLVVRLGDTQIYAVYHAGDKYVSGSWGHVRTANVASGDGMKRVAAQNKRRSATVSPSFMCKVTKWEGEGGVFVAASVWWIVMRMKYRSRV